MLIDRRMYDRQGNYMTREEAGKDDESRHIKTQIMGHSPEIDANGLIKTLTVSDIPDHTVKSELRRWVLKYQKTHGGYVIQRRGFGDISFGENELEQGVKYVKTQEEAAALLAVPAVLKNGVLVQDNENYKARRLDTITFGGLVDINGVPGHLGVVVRIAGKNRYHAHRILMPDGSVYKFSNEIETSGSGNLQHRTSDDADVRESPTAVSEMRLSQQGLSNNSKSGKNQDSSFASQEQDAQQKRRSHDEVEGQINMWDYMAEMDAQEAENGAQAEALRQFQNAWNELREAERAVQKRCRKRTVCWPNRAPVRWHPPSGLPTCSANA